MLALKGKVPEGLALPSARTRKGARLIRTFRCSTVKERRGEDAPGRVRYERSTNKAAIARPTLVTYLRGAPNKSIELESNSLAAVMTYIMRVIS